MIQIIELEKLSHSQAALTAAYRASLTLQERGWMRFTAAAWDKPAIVAMAGGQCVGGINFSEEADDLTISVNFAFCDPVHPAVLARLLARFRARYRNGRFESVYFTCHDGNEAMAKAVRVLGLVPHSHTYRMPVAAMDRRL